MNTVIIMLARCDNIYLKVTLNLSPAAVNFESCVV